MSRLVLAALVLAMAVLLAACPQTPLPPAPETPTPGFELSLRPASLSVQQGHSDTVTASVTRMGDFTGPVNLTLVGPPSGVSADALMIAEDDGTLTIRAAGDAAVGTHNVTVRGSGGELSDDATLNLTVTEAPPEVEDGFEISLTPSSLAVEQGQSGSVTVNVARLGEFAGAVEVTLIDPPSGVSAEPLTIAEDDASGTLVLGAQGDASDYLLTVRGTGHGLAHDAILALAVTEAPPKTYGRKGSITLMELTETSADGVETFVYGLGTFLELPHPQPLQGDPEPSLDTCSVEIRDDQEPEVSPPPPPGSSYLDAGHPLTVKADGTLYTTLNRQVRGHVISYATDSFSPPPAPLPEANLSIDIPGAGGGFPAFTGTFPSVPAFTLASPEDVGNVTLSTAFTWTDSVANATIVLAGEGINLQGERIVFVCTTQDDGGFSFPPSAQAELERQGFTTGVLGLGGRLADTLSEQGDVALVLSVARFTFYKDDR